MNRISRPKSSNSITSSSVAALSSRQTPAGKYQHPPVKLNFAHPSDKMQMSSLPHKTFIGLSIISSRRCNRARCILRNICSPSIQQPAPYQELFIFAIGRAVRRLSGSVPGHPGCRNNARPSTGLTLKYQTGIVTEIGKAK